MTTTMTTTTRPKSRRLIAPNGAKVRTTKSQRWVAVASSHYIDPAGVRCPAAIVLCGGNHFGQLCQRLQRIARERHIGLHEMLIHDMLTEAVYEVQQ